MKEENEMKKIVVTKDTEDVKGMIIPKGTILHVLKETKIHNPMKNKDELWRVVKIDNGTGHLDLMSETTYKVEVKK